MPEWFMGCTKSAALNRSSSAWACSTERGRNGEFCLHARGRQVQQREGASLERGRGGDDLEGRRIGRAGGHEPVTGEGRQIGEERPEAVDDRTVGQPSGVSLG